MAQHLADHLGDWTGAYAAFKRAASGPQGASSGALAAPPGKEWYARRQGLDAEALVCDDAPILTRELVDEAQLAATPVDIRFAYGTLSPHVFRDIATHLAAVRGQAPDVVEGVGHLVHYFPDQTAAYITRST